MGAATYNGRQMMDTSLIAILVIASFGLLSVGAIAATVYSFYQQRVYDKTTLPALYPDEPKTQVIVDDHDDDPIAEPRFQLDPDDDDDFTLEDKESNELMRSIERAAGIEKKPAPQKFGLRQRLGKAPSDEPTVSSPPKLTPVSPFTPPPAPKPTFGESPFPLATPSEGDSRVNS